MTEEETRLPLWRSQTIDLHTLYAKPRVSQKLLDDAAFDLEQWLSERIAEQMARLENKAFTTGHGEHQPTGFLHAPTVAPGQTSVGIEQWSSPLSGLIDTLIDMMHALPSEYVHGALWMMSRRTLSRIKHIKNASTGHYVWQPSLSHGTPETLLGYKIVVNDDMDNRLAFANFTHAYQIVDRSDVHILRDPYSVKPFVEFFATRRVGGSVVQHQAIKLLAIREDASC